LQLGSLMLSREHEEFGIKFHGVALQSNSTDIQHRRASHCVPTTKERGITKPTLGYSRHSAQPL
jgi:hypothetical protein